MRNSTEPHIRKREFVLFENVAAQISTATIKLHTKLANTTPEATLLN